MAGKNFGCGDLDAGEVRRRVALIFKDAPPRLSTKLVAELSGKSPSWFEHKRVSGGGPRYFRDGGRVFYLVEDIVDYLVAQRFSSTSEY